MELGRVPRDISITSAISTVTRCESFETVCSDDRKPWWLWRRKRSAPGKGIPWPGSMDGAAQGVRPPGKSCRSINCAFIFCCKNKISSLATWWRFRGIVSASSCLPVPALGNPPLGASAGWQGRRILFLLSGAQAGWAHYLSKSKEMAFHH